jgi:hypothetical protein
LNKEEGLLDHQASIYQKGTTAITKQAQVCMYKKTGHATVMLNKKPVNEVQEE